MHTYVCLLRAVNVGGTGKLPMADLRALCEASGFSDVRTYIASGNVVLRSPDSADQVQGTLQAALAGHVGKPVGVLVRTPAQMSAVLADNPFPHAAPDRTLVVFLDQPPRGDALQGIRGQAGEELALGTREIYVHYRDGMGNSRLQIPAAKAGTARNLNTVARLVGLAE